MREHALSFDGRATVLPPINYDGWDADAIMGCECDQGYGGYDCSERTCPYGRDPTIEGSASTDREEEFVLECQADEGYFTLTLLGERTQPIPYDASPAIVQHSLQSIYGVGRVRVAMRDLLGDGSVAACGASESQFTSIWFLDFKGDRPPMRVSYGDTANTRQWRNGSTPLALSSGDPVLNMVTKYTISCPACSGCGGEVYLKFRDSISSPVSITTSAANLVNAMEELTDLMNMNYPNLDISVEDPSATGGICAATASEKTILVRSDIGNIETIELLTHTWTSDSDPTEVEISLTGAKSAETSFECSNQGLCNRKTGQCECLNGYFNNQRNYFATGSDGEGNPGSRGDCGYLDVVVAGCSGGCSGHGFCENATGVEACVCHEGWSGYDCQVGSCPTGRAWFDEAISSSEAHQLATCSNMGTCDKSTGRCLCADGYSGDACQYMNCPFSSSAGLCNGNGWCMSMHSWASSNGFAYGDFDNWRARPDAWDAFMIHNCICSAYTGGGTSSFPFIGDKRKPPVATKHMVSGFPAMTRNLMGYRGYDCSEKNCPVGNLVVSTSNSEDSGELEVQRVVCTLSSSSSDSFTLKVFGALTTGNITGDMSASQIESTIEYLASVGNVTVSFPNSASDSITTACDPSHSSSGGFLVQFDTELGDLPLMTSASGGVTVSEAVQGSKTPRECSGLKAGYCDRKTGDCVCSGRYGSSNGTNYPGNRGDCGYLYPE